MSQAVYWFTNDLRLGDNDSLCLAVAREPSLHCIYCLDPRWLQPNRYGRRTMGAVRYRFLYESLQCLQHSLKALGHTLTCYYLPAQQVLSHLHQTRGVDRIYHSVNAGYDEQGVVQQLRQQHTHLRFIATHTHTLLDATLFPFPLQGLPKTFSAFRKKVEHLRERVPEPVAAPAHLGEPPLPPPEHTPPLPKPKTTDQPLFTGGERAGQQHLANYFSENYASHYKQTRNALDDFTSSTKFSPWLAQGCISPRQILSALQHYETLHGADENTYWIYFELLWREYFQWYAHKHGADLFAFEGITQQKPLTSFYHERFQRWCTGSTPYPIINACMHQLNHTGYLSNRGRQLAASCFVNELQLDWRYGAAYFEEKLVDYDVAANWGNWQYLAGVGADPRGQRHFNLDKQANTYDPQGTFTQRWHGHKNADLPLDAMDAVGWPTMTPETTDTTTPTEAQGKPS